MKDSFLVHQAFWLGICVLKISREPISDWVFILGHLEGLPVRCQLFKR